VAAIALVAMDATHRDEEYPQRVVNGPSLLTGIAVCASYANAPQP
jgi:hypothetical protein